MSFTRSTTVSRRAKQYSADSDEARHEVQVNQPKFIHDRSDEFFAVTKHRVLKYLDSQGLSRFGGVKLITEGAFMLFFCLLFYLTVIFGDFPTLAALAISVLFGISALLLALTVGHDAAHGTLVRSRAINDLAYMLTFSLIGADSFLWKIRHIRSHHISPNVDNFDVDVSENGIVRLSPLHQRRWYHRFQHIYAPILYGFISIHTILYYDLRCLIEKKLDNTTIKSLNTEIILKFLAEKIIFISVMFAIPYSAMELPWWHVAIGVLIVSYVNSIVFMAMLIGTHHGEGIKYPTTDKRNFLPHGWAYHQIATALDWFPSSKIANFISGGSNTHVAHHLFPNVSHIHYVEITRIIKEEAERFDMPYKETSFFGMVASHYRHLKTMGAKNEPVIR